MSASVSYKGGGSRVKGSRLVTPRKTYAVASIEFVHDAHGLARSEPIRTSVDRIEKTLAGRPCAGAEGGAS